MDHGTVGLGRRAEKMKKWENVKMKRQENEILKERRYPKRIFHPLDLEQFHTGILHFGKHRTVFIQVRRSKKVIAAY